MKRTKKKLKIQKAKGTGAKATKKVAKKPPVKKAAPALKKVKQKAKVQAKTKQAKKSTKNAALDKKLKKTEAPMSRNSKSQNASEIKSVGLSKKPGRPKRKISQKFEAARKLMKAEVAIATTPVVAAAPNTPSPKVLRPFRDAAKENKKRLRDKEKAKKRSHLFLAKPQKAGKPFKVDLRVHSPGTAGFFSMGGVETASALIGLSKVKGLDIVGITDYYNGIAIDDERHRRDRNTCWECIRKNHLNRIKSVIPIRILNEGRFRIWNWIHKIDSIKDNQVPICIRKVDITTHHFLIRCYPDIKILTRNNDGDRIRSRHRAS